MTGREAAIFAAVVDAVVDAEPPLPPVAATDAVAAHPLCLWLGYEHGRR